jgi:hypothetical protein
VILRNEATRLDALFPAVCVAPLELGTGETRLPFTIHATHQYCGQSADPRVPPCEPNGTPPPLTPGQYEAAYVASGESPIKPRPVAVTVVPATNESADTTASATTEFPPSLDPLQHGGLTWSVVLGGAYVEPGVNLDTDPTLAAAVATAEAAGYTTGPTDCDVGANAALGVDPNAVDFYTVSVHFETEAAARHPLQAFRERGHEGAAVAQVQTFCLD